MAERSRRRATHRGVIVAASACLLACTDARAPDEATLGGCRYDARYHPGPQASLDVSVRCEGEGIEGFAAREAVISSYVTRATTPRGETVERTDDGTFLLPAGEAPAIDYAIDLDGLAEAAPGDGLLIRRVGGAFMAPLSSWLLQPRPLVPEAPMRVLVQTPPGLGFTSALTDGLLASQDLPWATYGVLGVYEQRVVKLPGGVLEVVLLDGPVAAGREALFAWIRRCAEAVGHFYGRFPLPRAVLVVVPQPDAAGVLRGRLIPAGGAGVALVLGEGTTAAQLADDWMLVHELLHLGVPSIRGGAWLDEGLATYYEPIVRARAGLVSHEAVWRELLYDMPQGREAVEGPGVAQVSEPRAMYWGGAIVAMLADVRARASSGGRVGLEDGLRAVLDAGGETTRSWSLDRLVAQVDERLGGPLLAELVRDHAVRGSPVALEELFDKLGVVRDGSGVRLDDTAPWAAIRRAIINGAP